MACLSEFIRRFKESLPEGSYLRTPLYAHFVIEFLRINSQGLKEWYSPLIVVNFLPDDMLKFYYVNDSEPKKISYESHDFSDFKYHENWKVLEIVRPGPKGKTIVRITGKR